MTQLTPFEEVVQHYGSQKKLAEAMRVTPAAAGRWPKIRNGGFPPLIARMIEEDTNGKFKAADITGEKTGYHTHHGKVLYVLNLPVHMKSWCLQVGQSHVRKIIEEAMQKDVDVD